jgi:preprotein translocase subunit SecB
MAVEKAQAQDPAQQPQFTIEKIYVKDLSLEVPNAPQVFLERESPKVDIQLGTRATPLEEGHYEVVLTVTSTAKLGDKTVFLVEAHQAGIFQIRNLPPESLEPVLGVTCPNILFPYVRETVSDAIVRAGFPQFLLAPVNFELLYQQRMQQAQPAPTTTQ